MICAVLGMNSGRFSDWHPIIPNDNAAPAMQAMAMGRMVNIKYLLQKIREQLTKPQYFSSSSGLSNSQLGECKGGASYGNLLIVLSISHSIAVPSAAARCISIFICMTGLR